jgi:glyoxylase-like metal-dependent hydrolase (beta-lactamase superfamily II)
MSTDKPLRFLFEGTEDDPLVVLRSRFWGFNTIGVFSKGEACVIDPGIYPHEIAALDEAVRTRANGDRRVTHVVVTHSHHDHIRGWMNFPGAEVIFPAVAAEKTIEVQGRILAAKSKIDEKLGIDDAGFRYPEATITFRESASFQVGELPVEVRFLHGHSNCTSVVLLPTLKTMCTADYLVAPGLPYCRWQAHEFEQALATMRRWCDEENIERIIPAHDKPLIGRPAIDAALDEEVRYFEFLRAHVRERIAAGDSRERCARTAATTMTERRGLDLRGRERQDLDNAKRVLVEEWQGD